eukprot:GHVN01081243.1.p1 GENE.GHVN01081243.1~~GHVN01081243.1.p1  ORF type:complete len:613 (-),score=107.69 GHVN01081243.1:328-2166(-)
MVLLYPVMTSRHQMVNAMRHVWGGYTAYGWGHDTVRPLSRSFFDWVGLGVTILDSLGTLHLMGMDEEFDEAVEWVSNQMLDVNLCIDASFFETTIRALGGLLSAASMSGRDELFEAAAKLGDRYRLAFKLDDEVSVEDITKQGQSSFIVPEQLNVCSGKDSLKGKGSSTLARLGSASLELKMLTHVTQDLRFSAIADKTLIAIQDATVNKTLDQRYFPRSEITQLRSERKAVNSGRITVGAEADSYFEYLLKQWILTGKKETHLAILFNGAMESMFELLVKETTGPKSLMFISTAVKYDRVNKTEPTKSHHDAKALQMEHLSCFAPGMLALAMHELPIELVDLRWARGAIELGRTCREMYRVTKSGLSGEVYRFFVDDKKKPKNSEIEVVSPHGEYSPLRPEAVESFFYLFFYTGDVKYRQWALELFEALESKAKGERGFCSIKNVHNYDTEPEHKDETESFFMAETLKYLYLMFSPRPLAHELLTKWVFTTEAHPLPRLSEHPHLHSHHNLMMQQGAAVWEHVECRRLELESGWDRRERDEALSGASQRLEGGDDDRVNRTDTRKGRGRRLSEKGKGRRRYEQLMRMSDDYDWGFKQEKQRRRMTSKRQRN